MVLGKPGDILGSGVISIKRRNQTSMFPKKCACGTLFSIGHTLEVRAYSCLFAQGSLLVGLRDLMGCQRPNSVPQHARRLPNCCALAPVPWVLYCRGITLIFWKKSLLVLTVHILLFFFSQRESDCAALCPPMNGELCLLVELRLWSALLCLK